MAHAFQIIDVRLGRRVQNARQKRELSCETLANRMGMSVDALGAIEAGVQRASAAELFHLSRVLGIELRSLFDESRIMKDVNLPDSLRTVKANQALSKLVESLRLNKLRSCAA